MEYKIYQFAKIDSTNTWAIANQHLFDPEKITLITANEQVEGRGRFKNTWESPADENLYATFCFCLDKLTPNISLVLGLSAAKVIDAGLKWPNDLIINGKKVGGILVEAKDPFIFAGIGINVNSFPKGVGQETTSLKNEGKECSQVLERLQDQFQKDLETFKKEGFKPFLERYKKALIHKKGDRISHSKPAFFHSINEDGSLNVTLENGEISTMY